MRVFVCVPYAGEPIERLEKTARSAAAIVGSDFVLQGDTERSLPKTLNAAARRAIEQGATHIMWLSTGDTVRPTRLQTPPPEGKAEFCLTKLNGGRVYPDVEEYSSALIEQDNQFCLGGSIIPVPVWEQIGGLDEELTYASDWKLAIEVNRICGWSMLPIVLGDAWTYPDGLTRGAPEGARDADRIQVTRWAKGLPSRLSGCAANLELELERRRVYCSECGAGQGRACYEDCPEPWARGLA